MVQPTGNAGIPGIVPLKTPYAKEDYKTDNNNTDKKIQAVRQERMSTDDALWHHKLENANFPYHLF